MRRAFPYFWLGFLLLLAPFAGATPLLISIHFPDRENSRLDAKGVEVTGLLERGPHGYSLTFEEWVSDAVAQRIETLYKPYESLRKDESRSVEERLRLPIGPARMKDGDGYVRFRWSYPISGDEFEEETFHSFWHALDFGPGIEPLAISIPVRSRENMEEDASGLYLEARGPYKRKSFEPMACVVTASGDFMPLRDYFGSPKTALSKALSCGKTIAHFFAPAWRERESKRRDYRLPLNSPVPPYEDLTLSQ